MTDITFPTHMPPVAGVDIGGTKVAVSVADGRGVRGKLSQPTAVRGGRDALAAQVVDMVRQSCTLAGVAVADLAGVGVSSCGPFVMRDGMVELNTPNICGGMAGAARGLPNDWPTAYLEAPLRQVFPVVRVENDGIDECLTAPVQQRRQVFFHDAKSVSADLAVHLEPGRRST